MNNIRKSYLIYTTYEDFFKKIDKKKKEISNCSEFLGVPNPITTGWINLVNKNNLFVKKDDLIVGNYYYGSCRNARFARWNGDNFTYAREKFGSYFSEDINHYEDDNGFDLFLPYFELTENEIEHIQYVKENVNIIKKE